MLGWALGAARHAFAAVVSAFPGLLTCSASVNDTWKCPGFMIRVKSSYALVELRPFLDDLFLKRKIHSDF